MNTSQLRSVLAALIALSLPAALSAQLLDEPHEHAVCGMQAFNGVDAGAALANTARNAPAVYRNIMERSKAPSRLSPLSASVVTTHQFNVLNRVTQQFDEVTGVLVFTGRRARIWVDVADTARIKKTTIAALARGLDTATAATSRNANKGLIENDEEVFGQAPPNQFSPEAPNVEDFLLTDIQDNIAGGAVLGYFFPLDQTDVPGSNQMNILYIDSREGLGSQSATALTGILSTLAHEYQHLIHYNQNPNSQSFYNEGCSETASILCGYRSRTNGTYLNASNVPLLRWSDGSVYTDLEIDYQRAMSFVLFCYEQFGEAFLTKLTSSRSNGMSRITDALTKAGKTGDWRTTVKGFQVANYVRKSFTDPRYIYQAPLSTSTAKVTNGYLDSIPTGGQATVQAYAGIYNRYSFTATAGMSIKFEAAQSFAALALLYRENQLVEVRELNNGVFNAISADSGYNKMVFTVVNLSNAAQSIKWTVERLAAGVDEAAAITGGPAVTSISPNPASGPVRVAWRTANAGAVTMQMFDMAGRPVRNVVTDDRMEAGEHETAIDTDGLPAGVYLLRIAQGAAAVTRAVNVVR